MSANDASAGAHCSIISEADLLRVRQVVRASSLELGLVDQTKFVTAASELSRNILKYAGSGGGHVQIDLLRKDQKRGVRAVFTDSGPGISDVELAMKDGFSTGGSLGLGLPGARRLVDEFSISSSLGQGTTVTIVKWVR